MVGIIGVVLLKFTFIVFELENLSFGHSVACFSLHVACASWLKSNLRPSSQKCRFRHFSFLFLLRMFREFIAQQLRFRHSVACFSLHVACASWLKSNLRPSSEICHFRHFSFLRPLTKVSVSIFHYLKQKTGLNPVSCFNWWS